LSFVIIAFVIVFLNYNKSQEELVETTTTDFLNFQKLFYSLSKTQAENLKMALENIMNDKKVVSLFENGEREELADYLVPLFKNSLLPVYNIKQVQFHTSPAISFLRLHKPEKFGDDLSAFRGTVVYTNETKKEALGVEVGRGGPGLRVVLPVFGSKKQHLGSVEFGGGLTSILDSVATLFKMDYAIGIKKDVFEKARRFKGLETDIKKDEVIYYTYSNDTARLHTKDMPRITLDKTIVEGNLATYSFPIYDFLENIVGYITVYSDLTHRKNEINSGLLKFVGIITLVMVLASFIMVLLLRIAINPLNDFIEVLDGLTEGETGGDLTQRLAAKHGDEVGKASRSINKFIELTMNLISEIKGKSKGTIELGEGVYSLSLKIHDISVRQKSILTMIDSLSNRVKTQAGSSKDNSHETVKAILHEAQLISKILSNLSGINNDMRKISGDEEKLSGEIAQLSKEVVKIKEITEIIDLISEQTNLLALNASIEAARAGEQGRGFAVVAEEIHKLSTQTQDALRKIDGRIEELSTIVEGLSRRILTNSKGINNLAEDIKVVFDESNALLRTSEDTIRTSEVARVGSENILNIVDELNSNIRNVLKVTDENDQASTQLEKVATGMKKSMAELGAKMDLFKTENEDIITKG
jgi:methyl-accepting chemotaxis protein